MILPHQPTRFHLAADPLPRLRGWGRRLSVSAENWAPFSLWPISQLLLVQCGRIVGRDVLFFPPLRRLRFPAIGQKGASGQTMSRTRNSLGATETNGRSGSSAGVRLFRSPVCYPLSTGNGTVSASMSPSHTGNSIRIQKRSWRGKKVNWWLFWGVNALAFGVSNFKRVVLLTGMCWRGCLQREWMRSAHGFVAGGRGAQIILRDTGPRLRKGGQPGRHGIWLCTALRGRKRKRRSLRGAGGVISSAPNFWRRSTFRTQDGLSIWNWFGSSAYTDARRGLARVRVKGFAGSCLGSGNLGLLSGSTLKGFDHRTHFNSGIVPRINQRTN